MEQPPLSLSVPSDLRMLSVVRAFAEAACRVAEFEPSRVHGVVLAAGEAFTNAVRHAHADRPGAQIHIECWLSPAALEIHFHDQGKPFDIDAVPHLNPRELRIGGRGVYLMRTLMDELTCLPRADGGNTLKMVKYRDTLAVRDCG